jgi:hypothetical protein
MKIRLVETGFCETFQIDPNIKLGSWIESLVKHNAMVRFFSRSKHGYSATLMFNDKGSLEAFRVDKHQEHPAAKKIRTCSGEGRHRSLWDRAGRSSERHQWTKS